MQRQSIKILLFIVTTMVISTPSLLFPESLYCVQARVDCAWEKTALQAFITSHHELTYEQISSQDYEKEFEPYPGKDFNLGLTGDTLWIKCTLPDRDNQNRMDTEQLVLYFDYNLENIDIFIPMAREEEVQKLSGGFGIYTGDELPALGPLFMIPAGYCSEQYTYIRISTSGSFAFQLLLQEYSSFVFNNNPRILYLGLLSGILSAMAIYNVIVFIVLRYKAYLFYFFYVLSALLYASALTGSFRVLSIQLANFLFHYAEVLSFSTMFFFALFTYAFLNIRGNIPKMKPFFFAVMALSVTGSALILSGVDSIPLLIAYLIGAGVPLLSLVSIIMIKHKGLKVSPYYMAGITMLFIAVTLFVLRGWGLAGHSPLIMFGIFTAVATESMLYSFALADQIRDLNTRYSLLQKESIVLSKKTVIDDLTGLHNKRYFSQKFQEELEHAKKEEYPLSLALLDLDHFKNINDTYGHRKGDEVLQRLGLVIKETVLESGHACRIGGEEFALILPRFTSSEAAELCETIRVNFAAERFKFKPGKELTITISIGISQFRDGSPELADELFDRVDKALYRAKYEGRNRIIIEL